MVSPEPRGLESLPARPPTPPREKQQEPDSSSKGHTTAAARRRNPLNPRLSLHTPPANHGSPESSDCTNTNGSRSRKRVGFSTEAQYREAPDHAANKENAVKQHTPLSAPSSSASAKPIKSILKPSLPSDNPLDPSAGQYDSDRPLNLAVMLDSTIKQLAGADRDSKLDAYMMLVRALKISNNLPDRIALQDKMSLFMQFIQRDMTSKVATGGLDSSLINHALTLLSTFLNFPAIASTLSNDFGVFTVDHCIRSFEDQGMPKDVVRHLMQVVASQDFSPKVMTADRVGRLVSALNNIDEHIKGKSIVMSRIIIYRKLVKQVKQHMAVHSDWLKDLFSDMLNPIKEIRAAAVSLGLEASSILGKEKQFSKKVMDLLQSQGDEGGQKFIMFYTEKLKEMTQDKNESASVPQAWSVIILLLRCPVDRWEYFSPWLDIIQRCFNSSDPQTKVEANYAWNRLVYALQLHETSFNKTLSTICQPFLSQLKRKSNSKHQEGLRRIVLGSICNLFYYAFKPSANQAHIGRYWDVCVVPLIKQLAHPEVAGKSTAVAEDNLAQATMILTRLFESSSPRIWKDEHVFETPVVKVDELPALDPKWIRRNATQIFAVAGPILHKSFLNLGRPASNTQRMWRTLIGAVASAASKEVKVSTDTTSFMADALGLLHKIWSDGIQSTTGGDEQKFLSAAQEYLSTMINALGLLPFTEKLLSLSKQHKFVPSATPSHRTGKNQGLTRTPLHHLFSLLSTIPRGIADGDGLCELIKAVFNPFFAARSSRMKIDLAHELIQLMPVEAKTPYGPWVFVSEIFSLSLENSQSSHALNNSGSAPTVGHEYRDMVKHLERGLRSTPRLPWEHWQALFLALSNRVTEETGEAGLAIVVVEPLARVVLESSPVDAEDVPSLAMKATIELIASAKQPRDQQALDAARRRLWGTPVAGSRSASFEPFDWLYKLTNQALEVTYSQAARWNSTEEVLRLLTETAGFLSRCNQSLVFRTLSKLQQGISHWVQDQKGRYGSRQSPELFDAVKLLWERICSILVDIEETANFQLETMEPLLCSSFQSKHRYFVNSIATIWNRAFEQAEEVVYPDTLKTILLSLRNSVDLVLPGLDIASNETGAHYPTFSESQDDLDAEILQLPKSKPLFRDSTPLLEPPSSSRPSSPTAAVKLSLPPKTSANKTPSRSSKRGQVPRLRHDDSQVQFAAIESSSPSRIAAESQVLTDRQREVRERQRETAALYSDVRSGAEEGPEGSLPPAREPQDVNMPSLPQGARVTTPEAEERFEEYVSSTPTPRRGQAPIIEDFQDMEDNIPSSPPEPRRNLYSSMQPRSRSSSMMDEFQFSSSPISASPMLQRSAAVKNEDEVPDGVEEERIIDDSHIDQDDVPMGDITNNLEDDVGSEQPASQPMQERPTTPTRVRPVTKAAEVTPKSDNEEFVDALTSPAPRSPRVLRSNASRISNMTRNALAIASQPDPSFDMSAAEERSFERLVVEIDSRKCQSSPVCKQPPSKRTRSQRAEPVSECITVNEESERSQRKRRRTRSSQVSSSSSIPPEASEEQASSRSTRKRKRSSEKSQGSGGKERKNRKYDDAEDPSIVPDSQVQGSLDTSALSTEQDGSMDGETSIGSISSRDVSQSAGSSNGEADSQAVDMQILTEASQETPQATPKDEEMLSGVDESMSEKPTMASIMSSLRSGLEGLRSATLSRDEVYKIEDMFMDIRNAVSDAERRSRA